MKKLLNKLIEMGWKPYNRNYYKISRGDGNWILYFHFLDTMDCIYATASDLCSIDSGLWQFVVEKKLFYTGKNKKYYFKYKTDTGNILLYSEFNVEYRLMLSSIQEDKEKFILENIKIDE